MRTGQSFGRWTTEARLGRGGNGEVWRATAVDGEAVALKVLHRRNRLQRFRDEIYFLREYKGAGVVPLVDAHLPDEPSEPAWYTMPIATPLREALGPDPEPSAVVKALAEVAETLAALHEVGVGHRDIKPDNLFEVDGAVLVGDFGLVAYPTKDARTDHGLRLGPIDYMAPEMRENADTADPVGADVYALAKTLWTLMTSSTLPLPGPHRSDDEAYALVVRVSYERAAELDRLLAQMTRHDPATRPRMRDVADELAACLAPPPERLASSSRDQLSRRVSAMTSRGRDIEQTALELRRSYNAAEQALRDTALSPTYHELGRHLDGFRSTYNAATTAMNLLLEPVRSMFGQTGWAGHFAEQGNAHPTMVTIATGIRLPGESSNVVLCAYCAVDRSHPSGPTTIVTVAETAEAPLGSARQATAIERLAAEMYGAIDDTLRAVVDLLAAPLPDVDPDGLASKLQIRLARLRGVSGERGNEPRLVLMLHASEPLDGLDVRLESADASVELAMRVDRAGRGSSKQEWKLPSPILPGRYRVSVTDGEQSVSSEVVYSEG